MLLCRLPPLGEKADKNQTFFGVRPQCSLHIRLSIL